MINALKSLASKSEITSEEIKKLCELVSDNIYINYMYHYNGGIYCDGSLVMYSMSSNTIGYDLINTNKLLADLYTNHFDGLIAFGRDTFGNQFCFNELLDVIIFNIESGEKELLANSFSSWIKTLDEELDYLTGWKLRSDFANESKALLNHFDRLCPKIPFIINGEYNVSNLYAASTEICISTNNNIFNQTKDMFNGESVIIASTE